MAAPQTEADFLRELDKKLWTAADRLRSNLDAAVYKHAVLGLVFLKYVSDSFEIRQKEVEEQLRDPKSDFFLDPAEYGGSGGRSSAVVSEAYEDAIRALATEDGTVRVWCLVKNYEDHLRQALTEPVYQKFCQKFAENSKAMKPRLIAMDPSTPVPDPITEVLKWLAGR